MSKQMPFALQLMVSDLLSVVVCVPIFLRRLYAVLKGGYIPSSWRRYLERATPP